MKKLLFSLLFIFIFTTNSQDLIESIDSVGSFTSQLTTPISLTGNFNELVISVGFPDVPSTFEPPVLTNPSQYPIYGVNENEVLLQTLIAINNGSYPVDQWYEPAFDNYFDVHSGGLYNVDFEFLKAGPNSRYLTSHNLSYFISLNNNDSNNVVWNKWQEILNDIAEVIYNDDEHTFDDIDAIHFTFEDLPKHLFHETYGGTIKGNVTLSSGGTNFYVNKPITIQRKAEAIVHENLHLLGKIAQHPDFDGFPDRGRDRTVGIGHHNMFWTYDMMYHNAPLPHTYSLYGLSPLLSHDLIYLGWIRANEIIEINSTNYSNYSSIKLADINYQLNSTQISQGYGRIVKVMIEEDYSPGLDEYFLVEFHNASEFDKAFGNYDEYQTHGYNTGVLIWHIKERTSGDNYIDLEAAVPYNGWYGNPIPDDNYPRDYDRSNVPGISVWNGNYAGDFDYLDDDFMKNIGTYSNPHWVFYFMPDGGRHVWETTTTPSYSWYPSDPTLFIREQSMRSDFFSDETIKGHVTDKLTDATRPSTKEWGELVNNLPVAEKTHIAITDIKRESGYMSLKVHYNYWVGEVTENSTMSGDVTVDGNLTVASGVTLNIEAGTEITFLNDGALIVNGTLNVNGTSSNKVIFDGSSTFTRIEIAKDNNNDGTSGFELPGGGLPGFGVSWGGIIFNSGSSGNIQYAEIKNAPYGIKCNNTTNADIEIAYSTFTDNTTADIYTYNSSPLIHHNSILSSNTNGIWCRNYSSPEIHDNTIKNHNYGIRCQWYSPARIVNQGTQYFGAGYNLITNNTVGIFADYYSDVLLGAGVYGGYNSIKNNSDYELKAYYGCDIDAEINWWGVSNPGSSEIYQYQSTVDYLPALSSDPLGSSIKGEPNDYPVVTTNSDSKADFKNALSLQREGKFDQAITLYKSILGKEGDSKYGYKSLIRISECYMLAGKSNFLDFLNTYVNSKNNSKNKLTGIALELENRIHLENKDFTLLLNNMDELLNNYSNDKLLRKYALFNKGDIYLTFFNDTTKAINVFQQLSDEFPNDQLVYDSKLLLGELEGNNLGKEGQLVV